MAAIAHRTEQCRVLLVEDSPADAALVGMSLDEADCIDFDVKHVECLRDALDALASRAVFDLVLLDLSLPDSRGAETFDAVHAVCGRAAVVVMTGLDDDDLGAELVHDGAQDYIIKTEMSGASFVRDLRYAIERKRTAAELEQARMLAVEAMRAKGEFLSSMSHEIRTPLNSIIGMADLLSETTLDEEQQRYVDVFRNQGEMLLELLNSILDLSKAESGSLELDHTPFDLEEMLESTLEMLAIPAHKQKLDLVCDIKAGTHTTLVGDPVRLRQVVVNLIGNAIKFTPKGQIALEVETDPHGEGPGDLRFTVADTGIGIPRDKQARIFERFAQADTSVTKQYGGTGLGLSLSLELVQLMGGRLWVESEPGVGSSFSFNARFEPQPDASRAWAADDPQGGRALLALVNATERAVAQRELEARGFSIESAESGPAAACAIEAERAAGAPFDLVVLDSGLPDEGAFEAVQAVGGEAPCEHFVMLLSADHRVGDVSRCGQLGISGWLVKPLFPAPFHQLVTDLLADGTIQDDRNTGSTGTETTAPTPLRILIADDSADNRSLLLAYLKNEPHTITLAENGKIAVDHFRKQRFDLVLMDMQMPVMDGYSATRAIRSCEKDDDRERTPVLALTAYAFPEERQRSLDAGCDVHLTKPIRKKGLLEAIAAHAPPTKGLAAAPASSETPTVPIAVCVDEDLSDLIPGFLENRRGDLESLERALDSGDFETMQRLGHNMKGVGRGYGFDGISEIGAALERAAKDTNSDEASKQIASLDDYLSRVEITNDQAAADHGT